MIAPASRPVLIFACLGHAWFHILVALYLTLVLVIEPVWQRPYDELIELWTLGALLLGLGAPAAGWLGDRWGEVRVMIVFFLGIGAATIACGLAEGPLSLTAALALLGLFGAIYHPVGTAWVVKHTTTRGRALAVLGICGSLGAAVASLVAGGLADLFDWRLAFVIPGAGTFATGLALLWAYARGRVADRRGDVQAQAEPSRRDLRQAFAVLAVTMSLTTVVYYAFITMLPKWLDRELGAALGEGLLGLGALVTLVYLLGASAQFVGGHFADRGQAKAVYVASYLLKAVALVLALFVTGWPVVLAAVAVAFVFDIAAPVENVLIARFTSSRRRGLAYGLRNGIAILAGPLGVQLVSWLFDETAGFDALLMVLAAMVLVILLAALLLPAERPVTAGAESST